MAHSINSHSGDICGGRDLLQNYKQEAGKDTAGEKVTNSTEAAKAAFLILYMVN